MNLSLCMIVKNEEKNLPRCLRSAQRLVDEVVIVDTGSTDSTREVAISFGARLVEHTWQESFCDARNVSITNAKGNWILTIDADEEFEEASISKILSATNNKDVDGYALPRCKSSEGPRPFFSTLKTSLFRNMPEIRFSGIVHEDVFFSIAESRRRFLDAWIIDHNFNNPIQAKDLYYLGLCQRRLQLDATDNMAAYFAGLHSWRIGKGVQAITLFQQAVSETRRPIYSILSALVLTQIAMIGNAEEAPPQLNKAQTLLYKYERNFDVQMHPELQEAIEKLRPLVAGAAKLRSDHRNLRIRKIFEVFF
jgi:glycosyltransferase involved in cell wall biosynthesis